MGVEKSVGTTLSPRKIVNKFSLQPPGCTSRGMHRGDPRPRPLAGHQGSQRPRQAAQGVPAVPAVPAVRQAARLREQTAMRYSGRALPHPATAVTRPQDGGSQLLGDGRKPNANHCLHWEKCALRASPVGSGVWGNECFAHLARPFASPGALGRNECVARLLGVGRCLEMNALLA